MKIVDIRPTLASWPKRIYEWHELPEEFHPALARWRDAGMEPGNVTYIPPVHLGSSDPQFATAWFGDYAMIQTLQNDVVDIFAFKRGDIPALVYEHQTLKCKIIVPRVAGSELEFDYAQVKEDQLRPVISLLLGQPGERPYPIDHPDHSMDSLPNRTLMYHPSILCRRFDDNINDWVWFRSSLMVLPFIARRRPRPEYLFANMDRGFVVIDRNFYRRRVFYFTWEDIISIKMVPHQWRRGPGVVVTGKSGIVAEVPLIQDNIRVVAEYLEKVKALGIPNVEIECDIEGLMGR